MTYFKIISLALLVSICSLFSVSIFAIEPVSISGSTRSAINQHDTTAYHLSNKATKGEKRFAHKWKSVTWNFATAEQRDLFAANPEKYSPAYNGFCSNALTLDEGLIRTDGTVWQIFGDQLHLFYAERGRVRWMNGDYADLKKQADAAWKEELKRFN
jgi:hypothetical protein